MWCAYVEWRGPNLITGTELYLFSVPVTAQLKKKGKKKPQPKPEEVSESEEESEEEEDVEDEGDDEDESVEEGNDSLISFLNKIFFMGVLYGFPSHQAVGVLSALLGSPSSIVTLWCGFYGSNRDPHGVTAWESI